ncbi:threonine ammonia-lyase, biosynthetic [uncultured Ferrimonas sp.]|uniref:threonine ammonia-lyase, biosynthetic n=1 Tax=uncultured Ferrimonas sp. TaxID=432640 RepID=UPI002624391A|nr:threonine ammonia-lyase, biosynthetic [uncultured Ferrimonas sp.]
MSQAATPSMLGHALVQQTLQQILTAPVYDVAKRTELSPLPKLSARFGHQLWLKREDQQPVHSFKLRGAYTKLHGLTLAQRQAGVVAASAGNHAQGLALAAQQAGVKAVIVMPTTTPEIKVSAVRGFGAEVLLHGESFDSAYQQAHALAAQHGYTMVPPFDDAAVIAGQGTIGQELLQQQRDLNAVFVPVGGGGLIAGVAACIKALAPQIKVIGVEPEDAACLQAALAAGKPVPLARVGLFADGVAVKQIGAAPFALAQHCVDEVITVSADEICAAIQDIYQDTRAIAEPAGALAVAGMKRYAQRQPEPPASAAPQQWAAILSGANINFHTLRYVSERCELGEGKEALLAVTIPERQGAFLRFCQVLGQRAITEFNYRFSDRDRAHVFVGIKLGQADEINLISQALTDAGYPHQDLSADETAKLHVRYMVGGVAPTGVKERLFHLHFPEHPGALAHFLTQLGDRCNISLFHYRNHGAASGRVLLGLELGEVPFASVQTTFAAIDADWREVSDSPAYQFFLRG